MQKPNKKRGWAVLQIALVSLVILLSSCWIENIDTPYYVQTTPYHCGAASSQMILNSENLGIYIPNQTTIYNYIHSHNSASSGWASDPEGVKDVLNFYANPAAYFNWSATTNQDSAVNLLAYTIDRYGVPPTSLINHFAHWVVVRGVHTDVQPSTNPSYTIYGFFVNDPGYWDDALGVNTYIDIDEWKTSYFTTGTWSGSPGSAKYISVVDPKPVPKRRLLYPKVPERRPYIVPEGEIYRQAEEMLEKIKNDKRFAEYFKSSMEILKPARSGEPILVTRSDLKENAYYIVPIVNEELRYREGTETVGAILFDAYSGAFQETSLLTGGISFEQFFNKDLAVKQILSEENRANLALRGDVKVTDLQLVWQPSAQSPKAYYPNWKVSGLAEKDEKPRTLGYLNWDGNVYIDLLPVEDKVILGG